MLESEFKPNNTKKKIIPSIQAIKKLSVGMGIDFDQLLSSIDGDVSLIDNENRILLNDNELNLLEIYYQQRRMKNMIMNKLLILFAYLFFKLNVKFIIRKYDRYSSKNWIWSIQKQKNLISNLKSFLYFRSSLNQMNLI